MSIFSHLRKSRQQAKEHNAKLAEQKKKDAQTTPYRHVPTHAASDAIASAPPAWREANDRPRIVEQNRRRSAMAAAGFSMNMPSTTNISAMPRVSSSLSYVSYPSGQATPHVGMPRAYSSNSIHHPYGQSREVVYSMPDAAMSQPSSWKGKEVNANSLSPYDVSGSSNPTPEGSSRASNSSHDELEMIPGPSAHAKTSQSLQVPQAQSPQLQPLQTYHQVQQTQQAKQLQNVQQAQIQTIPQPPIPQAPVALAPAPQPLQPMAVQPMAAQQPQVQDTSRPVSSHAHRLHPSHRRTSSELSDRTAVPVSAKPTTRDARPPPTSMRGFNYIPTAANQQSPMAAPKPAQPDLGGMRQNSYNNGFAPKAPSMPAVAPPAARNSSDLNLGSFSIPSPGLDLSGGGHTTPPSAGQTQHQTRTKEHYASAPMNQHHRQQQQQQQQQEMEPIVSKYTRHSRSEMPPPIAHENLVNIFPEPVSESYNSSGRGKLNKSKKTRWSFSKSSPITA